VVNECKIKAIKFKWYEINMIKGLEIEL